MLGLQSLPSLRLLLSLRVLPHYACCPCHIHSNCSSLSMYDCVCLQPCNWPSVVSGGEMQLLAMARLLWHSPRIAVLDEAMSAIETQHAQKLMAELLIRGVVPISVLHDDALRPFHARCHCSAALTVALCAAALTAALCAAALASVLCVCCAYTRADQVHLQELALRCSEGQLDLGDHRPNGDS